MKGAGKSGWRLRKQLRLPRFFQLLQPRSGNMCGAKRNAEHPLQRVVAAATAGNAGSGGARRASAGKGSRSAAGAFDPCARSGDGWARESFPCQSDLMGLELAALFKD